MGAVAPLWDVPDPGDLACALFGLPRIIRRFQMERHYEEIGLLPSAGRTANGYRIYNEDDQHRLHFIQQAKEVGLTLDEIGEVLAIRRSGTAPCTRVIQLIDQKLKAIDEQQRALTDFRQTLLDLREHADIVNHTDACVCGIIEQQSGYATKAKRA